MATWLKLLIGLAVITAGILALVQLTRRRSTTTGETVNPALASNMWALSDSLQQTHLNALAAQLADLPSRADVAAMMRQNTLDVPTRTDIAAMIQQALAALPTGSNPTNPIGTDVDLAALFEQQMN